MKRQMTKEGKDMSKTETDNNANLPNGAGTWTGVMDFEMVKGNLTLVVNQDGAGRLSGMASSTPPLCRFSLSVKGSVYHDGTWFAESEDDGKTVGLSGRLNTNVISGTVNLGEGTGCGVRKGGTFTVTRVQTPEKLT
jgi:hypothetical protein